MNFEEWQETERAALRVIGRFAALGVKAPTGLRSRASGDNMSTLERVVYLKDRARAMDAAFWDDDGSAIQPIPVRDKFSSLPKNVQNLAARHAELRSDLVYTDNSPELIARVKEQIHDVESELSALGYRWDKKLGYVRHDPRNLRATDAHPGSDLEYYNRCAAESTRLA